MNAAFQSGTGPSRILALSLLVLLCVLTGEFVARPLYETYTARQSRLVFAEKKLGRLQSLAARRAELGKQVAALNSMDTARQSLLEAASISQGNAVLQKTIKQALTAENAQVRSLRNLSVRRQGDLTLLSVAVDTQLSLAGLKSVLYRIEYGDIAMVVSELVVRSSGGWRTNSRTVLRGNDLQARLIVQAYMRTEK